MTMSTIDERSVIDMLNDAAANGDDAAPAIAAAARQRVKIPCGRYYVGETIVFDAEAEAHGDRRAERR